MKKILLVILASMAFYGCSSDSDNEEDTGKEIINPIDKIPNISLDYNYSSNEIKLSRNVEEDGATISLKNNSKWIKQLRLENDLVKFSVEENLSYEYGHRFDTILINKGANRIGTICVSQARRFDSNITMQWCNDKALYKEDKLSIFPGKEATIFIYNLEKTTNGKDNYKNYPAFAYCIDMNHDPENNMEWHLSYDIRDELEKMGYNWAEGREFWTSSNGRSNEAYTYKMKKGQVIYSAVRGSSWKQSYNYVFASRDIE